MTLSTGRTEHDTVHPRMVACLTVCDHTGGPFRPAASHGAVPLAIRHLGEDVIIVPDVGDVETNTMFLTGREDSRPLVQSVQSVPQPPD